MVRSTPASHQPWSVGLVLVVILSICLPASIRADAFKDMMDSNDKIHDIYEASPVAESGRQQFGGVCDGSSLQQLELAINGHNDYLYRMTRKFKDVWYFKGDIFPEQLLHVSTDEVIAHLRQLGDRKSAVLFHKIDGWYDDKGPHNGLRAWLITSSGTIVCAKPQKISARDWQTFDAMKWASLGTRGAKRPRGATLDHLYQSNAEQSKEWEDLLRKLSQVLLPPEVVLELTSSGTDTLIVVPITLMAHASSIAGGEVERRTLSLGAIPYAALPLGDGPLASKLSIVIAPGFSSLTEPAIAPRHRYFSPIVLGNPTSKKYNNLPGAEAEAIYVANRLNTKVHVGQSATRKLLVEHLMKQPKSVDLIYLATHGIASAKNPVTESFLVFSDLTYNAKAISELRRKMKGGQEAPLLEGNPLVIMSACQTALGKNFQAGTIGLAAAWHWAGASKVVMSLWNVDDEATQQLMEQFMDLVVSGQAVDKALQTAMLRIRETHQNPSNWASFSIYGAPERIEATVNHSPAASQ